MQPMILFSFPPPPHSQVTAGSLWTLFLPCSPLHARPAEETRHWELIRICKQAASPFSLPLWCCTCYLAGFCSPTKPKTRLTKRDFSVVKKALEGMFGRWGRHVILTSSSVAMISLVGNLAASTDLRPSWALPLASNSEMRLGVPPLGIRTSYKPLPCVGYFLPHTQFLWCLFTHWISLLFCA